MNPDEALLQGFTFEPGLDHWEGERHVPCWGGLLPITIAAPAAGPSARQREVLRALLAHPGDLRGEVERAVFDHYRREVEGTTGYVERGADVTAEQAPRLRHPHGVWRLLHTFSVFVPASPPG